MRLQSPSWQDACGDDPIRRPTYLQGKNPSSPSRHDATLDPLELAVEMWTNAWHQMYYDQAI